MEPLCRGNAFVCPSHRKVFGGSQSFPCICVLPRLEGCRAGGAWGNGLQNMAHDFPAPSVHLTACPSGIRGARGALSLRSSSSHNGWKDALAPFHSAMPAAVRFQVAPHLDVTGHQMLPAPPVGQAGASSNTTSDRRRAFWPPLAAPPCCPGNSPAPAATAVQRRTKVAPPSSRRCCQIYPGAAGMMVSPHSQKSFPSWSAFCTESRAEDARFPPRGPSPSFWLSANKPPPVIRPRRRAMILRSTSMRCRPPGCGVNRPPA